MKEKYDFTTWRNGCCFIVAAKEEIEELRREDSVRFEAVVKAKGYFTPLISLAE